MDIVALTAGFVVFFIIGSRGLAHVGDPERLVGAITEQAILPPRVIRSVGFAAPYVECMIGVGGVVALVAGRSAPRLVAAAAAAMLLLIYSVYILVARRRSPSAPCGCRGDHEPVSHDVLLRNAVLVACVVLTSLYDQSDGGGEVLLAAAGMAAVLAPLIWSLPGSARYAR